MLASRLLTRAEWGVWRAMPYRIHLTLDFAAGVGAVAMPWLANFSHNRRARNTFLVMGAISIAASLLSGVFGSAEEMPGGLLAGNSVGSTPSDEEKSGYNDQFVE